MLWNVYLVNNCTCNLTSETLANLLVIGSFMHDIKTKHIAKLTTVNRSWTTKFITSLIDQQKSAVNLTYPNTWVYKLYSCATLIIHTILSNSFACNGLHFFFLMLKFSDKQAKDFCFGEFDHQTIDFSFMTRPKKKTGPIYSSVGKGGH